MITRTGRVLYEQRGPLPPGMHGIGDAAPAYSFWDSPWYAASDQGAGIHPVLTQDVGMDTPGWWETQWRDAVAKFQTIWSAFDNSKVTLSVAGHALDSLDPATVDAGKLSDLKAREAALTSEELSIDDVVSAAIAKIREVESKLGWAPTQLGIFGIDDALAITAIATAGVAAIGYYVYKITTHTEDVNQLSLELQALGKGVLTPEQLIQLQSTQQASSTGGIFQQVLDNVLPYVGIALGGYLLFKLVSRKL